MTIKKNLENEYDTRWRTKGGAHRKLSYIPKPCHGCSGRGFTITTVHEKRTVVSTCPTCGGAGEIEE